MIDGLDALVAGKADTATVNAALAAKADAAAVATALAAKADADAMTTALAAKANASALSGVMTGYFESAETFLNAGADGSINHGLGGTPKLVML